MVSICDLERIFLELTYAVLKIILYLVILNLLFFLIKPSQNYADYHFI